MTHPSGVPFEAGQPVIVGTGPMHDRRWFRTSVRRVDARIVWLEGAPEDQSIVDVQPGQDVTCHSWRDMDALYQTVGRVTFTRLAPEPLIGLTVHGVERVQQREYVRVPLSTEATGLLIPSSGADTSGLAATDTHEGLDTHDEQPTVQLTVHDLSAGGLRGSSNLLLQPGDELTLGLRLPRADSTPDIPIQLRGRVVTLRNLPEPLYLRARVVRRIETARDEEFSHELGIAFVDVPKAARERIIRFALDIQRERRRRGMM
jgi:hypothetical protein